MYFEYLIAYLLLTIKFITVDSHCEYRNKKIIKDTKTKFFSKLFKYKPNFRLI